MARFMTGLMLALSLMGCGAGDEATRTDDAAVATMPEGMEFVAESRSEASDEQEVRQPSEVEAQMAREGGCTYLPTAVQSMCVDTG